MYVYIYTNLYVYVYMYQDLVLSALTGGRWSPESRHLAAPAGYRRGSVRSGPWPRPRPGSRPWAPPARLVSVWPLRRLFPSPGGAVLPAGRRRLHLLVTGVRAAGVAAPPTGGRSPVPRPFVLAARGPRPGRLRPAPLCLRSVRQLDVGGPARRRPRCHPQLLRGEGQVRVPESGRAVRRLQARRGGVPAGLRQRGVLRGPTTPRLTVCANILKHNNKAITNNWVNKSMFNKIIEKKDSLYLNPFVVRLRLKLYNIYWGSRPLVVRRENAADHIY